MKFEWEEIWVKANTSNSPFYEDTFRAKVKGGWLIRHGVYCNYAYETDSDEKLAHYVHDE